MSLKETEFISERDLAKRITYMHMAKLKEPQIQGGSQRSARAQAISIPGVEWKKEAKNTVTAAQLELGEEETQPERSTPET